MDIIKGNVHSILNEDRSKSLCVIVSGNITNKHNDVITVAHISKSEYLAKITGNHRQYHVNPVAVKVSKDRMGDKVDSINAKDIKELCGLIGRID